MVSGDVCLAHGSSSSVRARRIPMVSSLAVAISEVALDAADDRLDCEHFPHLHHVALALTGASMGAASRLGHAGGIWMRGHRCRNRLVTPWKEIWTRWHAVGLRSIFFFYSARSASPTS